MKTNGCFLRNSLPYGTIADAFRSRIAQKVLPGAHKNFLAEAPQKFVAYNRTSFEFLEIIPTIVGSDQNTSIVFRTSRYIGAIPLPAPDTGKQIGDFVVGPRFVGRDRFVDYIEILDLLGSEISPEVIDSLPLVSGRNFRPPFYLEAAKFISSLERMLRRPWGKFDSVEVISGVPLGQINWKKYIQHENQAAGKLPISC